MASSSASRSEIVVVPAPWALKSTIYSFMWLADAKNIPSFIYSPLEASSTFSAGKPVGGLGLVQLIRYSETPVGPYDELVIVPGKFEYEVLGSSSKVKRSNMRITRAYVSQKETCLNGRLNWNIPKHLARFEFNALAAGGTEIKVFPCDTTGDPMETEFSATPFFTAVYKPIPYLPYFPLSLSPAKYVGMDLAIVQPPLPQGKSTSGELVATTEWRKVLPVEHTKKASLGWFDLQQPVSSGAKLTEQDALLGNEASSEADVSSSSFENWWPGFGRWRIGFLMEDCESVFEEGESWK